MSNRYAQRVEELKGEEINNGIPPIYVSEEDILELERELGVSLPEDYREFIRDYGDYGFFDNTTFPVESNSYGVTSGALEIVYGAASTYNNADYRVINLYRGICETDEWPRNWLPIATAGRDDRIVLSLAGEDKGAVYLIVAYLWKPDSRKAFWVADSFDEFMHLLYNAEEDD